MVYAVSKSPWLACVTSTTRAKSISCPTNPRHEKTTEILSLKYLANKKQHCVMFHVKFISRIVKC